MLSVIQERLEKKNTQGVSQEWVRAQIVLNDSREWLEKRILMELTKSAYKFKEYSIESRMDCFKNLKGLANSGYEPKCTS